MCSVTSCLIFNVYLLSGLIQSLFWAVNVDMLLPKAIKFLKQIQKKIDTIFIHSSNQYLSSFCTLYW